MRTVRQGVIDKAHECVLTIESGDIVDFETWTMWGNRAGPGLTLADVKRLRANQAMCGPHSLTGPVAVAGAEPGHVLRVDIQSFDIAEHGFNLVPPGNGGRGLLAAEFAEGVLHHFELDTATMTTQLGPATIPLRPFLGIMGVSPAADGPHNSTAPGDFGGNIDCPDLTAGSTLYLPIWNAGAGFYVGDAHAAQGCGEVNQTALETAMRSARLRLAVERHRTLVRPQAETKSHIITMGFDPDLRVASQQAVGDMVDELVRRFGFGRSAAYALCSLQVDLAVTQLVNGHCGIHARFPKSIIHGATQSNR